MFLPVISNMYALKVQLVPSATFSKVSRGQLARPKVTCRFLKNPQGDEHNLAYGSWDYDSDNVRGLFSVKLCRVYYFCFKYDVTPHRHLRAHFVSRTKQRASPFLLIITTKSMKTWHMGVGILILTPKDPIHYPALLLTTS